MGETIGYVPDKIIESEPETLEREKQYLKDDPIYTYYNRQVLNPLRAFGGNFWTRAINETVSREAKEKSANVIKSSTIAALGFVVLPIGAGISKVVNEAAGENGNLLRIALLAGTGVATTASFFIQRKAYQEGGYSSNPLGTGIYISTENENISSAIAIIEGTPQVALLNPYVDAGLIHGDVNALADGYIGTAIALSAWYMLWDALIAAGKDQEAIKAIKSGMHEVSDLINRFIPDFPEIPTYPPIRKEVFEDPEF